MTTQRTASTQASSITTAARRTGARRARTALAALAISAVSALGLGVATPAHAVTVFAANGVLLGNVCRVGMVWATGPFAPVGTACFNSVTGTWGVITAE